MKTIPSRIQISRRSAVSSRIGSMTATRLLLSHYDVNFLFVARALRSQQCRGKAAWRHSVRDKFRRAVQDMLKEKFEFYALAAHPDVDASAYFKAHFQETLGKTFRPYENQQLFSLALDREFPADNDRLLALLGENFYVVPVELGEDPSDHLETERAVKGSVESTCGMGKFLFGIVTKQRRTKDGRQEITKEYMAFYNHEATEFVMRNMPGGDITTVKYFVPMYDGGISGYYEVTGITFGSRKQPLLDENDNPVIDANGEEIIVKMPCLNIRLGAYTSLGDHIAEIPKFRNWNGQIHSYTEVLNLFNNTSLPS